MPGPVTEEELLPPLPVLSYVQRIERSSVALRQGKFDAAAFGFAGAMEAEDAKAGDPRPYIGLAAAFRGKGMNFDAARVLNDAKARFPRDPTIETMISSLNLRFK